MGHFHAENISKIVNRMLHAGGMTIKACIEEMARTKTKFHASEGAYGPEGEDYQAMLGKGVDEILGVLYEDRLVEPVKLSRQQRKLFKQWRDGDVMDWSYDPGGEGLVFDSIEWRPLKKRLPVIREIES